jgi:hypothetical protein
MFLSLVRVPIPILVLTLTLTLTLHRVWKLIMTVNMIERETVTGTVIVTVEWSRHRLSMLPFSTFYSISTLFV